MDIYQQAIAKYPPRYSEAEVPAYELPKLGSRAQMLADFEAHMHGRLPISPPTISIKSRREGSALEGRALRGEYRVELSTDHGRMEFDLLVYLPRKATKEKVPIFLGLNFQGNHAVQFDPTIAIPTSWRSDANKALPNDGRGAEASRWPVDLIVQHGFGVATVYAGDFAPDNPEHVGEGILSLLPLAATPAEANVRGGAIAAWAYGLSRALDVLLKMPEIDPARIFVIGHSRMGKTALWAGACDERFAGVVSNNSGAGGAALSRRKFGERVVHLNFTNPHWFAPAFRAYNEREEDLPIDQLQLLAAIAPRACYVASATEDQWADPRGEYLALAAAAPAWGESLPDEMPSADSPISGKHIGYHLRSGKHDINAYDWAQFLTFADRVGGKIK